MPGNFKVCVVGGAGGIGQPLSMLMAMDPNVGELCVYDLTLAMVPAEGVAADLSHLNKKSAVKGFAFDKDDKAIDKAEECLTGCHLVLVPAGVPRKPGQDRKDLLNINAGIAKNIVEACATYCPEAVIALIVNPVNSVVPAMCELWKKRGLKASKIVGVTTLDVVRANKFVHELTGVSTDEIEVPVIGGHAGKTILSLFSQCNASRTISADQISDLDKQVQDAGTVVVAWKKGRGSATLSMAFAGARLGKAVLSGLAGVPATECAYVASSITDLPYFSSKVTFGKDGVEIVHPLGDLNDYEKRRLAELKPILLEDITTGLEYANDNEFAVPSRRPSICSPPAPIQKPGSFKVCIVGGAGGIGQPLSMLMAMDPNVAELCVYDLTLAMVPADGVAADLSHLNKKSAVRGFAFDKDDRAIDKASECLSGCHLVLVPAGVPRKPGQDRKDLLNINAGIAKNIVEACAKHCPGAVVALIVNPVNSVVPAMCELWKKNGLKSSKIVGVTTLDVVRANKFVHEITGAPLEEINVPVIGGHAGTTILPLFSQCKVARTISTDQIPALDKKVQDAGTVVVAAKNGKGSATLSMAFAGARLGKAVLAGLAGVPTTECAYVCSAVTDMPYLASKVTFGKDGVETVHSVGDLSDYEKRRLAELRPILLEEISAGLEYANENEFFSTSSKASIPRSPAVVSKTGNFKVCVVGGAGGIGQPLSMLMAMDTNVAELCVYDLTLAMVPADGVAADLSHLNKKSKVNGFAFDKDDRAIDKAVECLKGCHLVLVPAGVPRKPGQDRKDLLNINAGIAKNIVEACAKYCPEAVVALIVNPVNSVVPAMCELWKKQGLKPSKIVGVTTLDVVRADKFVHEITGVPLEDIDVPVIGGHAGTTILPLFSQCKAGRTIPADQIPALDKKVQDAGTVVVAAKNGKGSATLSMAFAGARLGKAVLSGLAGEPATECAYVCSSVTDLPYFASKVTFGKDGVEMVHPLGDLSGYERKRLAELRPILLEEISAGLEYANENEFFKVSLPPSVPRSLPTIPKTGNFKVCVVGGAGGIGQPLSMLMAMDPNVSELCVYDLTLAMVPADGVAADLSHLNKKSKIRGFAFDKDDRAIDKAAECLTGCHLVLVPAGVPRKPGQDRKDLLNINAGIAKNIVEACAKLCPEAVVALIVNPVNSVVPAMCELWKKHGLKPSKIVGVTTLDVVRADKFVHEITGVLMEEIDVPVIGGHAGTTILPLFSQSKAARTISADQIQALDKKVQDAGTIVVAAKNGKGSATLSMAFAGARLGKAVLSGLAGSPATECAYVSSSVTDLPYFASKVTFGKDGVETVHPLGHLNDYEKKRLAELRPILLEEISAGLEYANENEFFTVRSQPAIPRQPASISKTGNFKVCVVGGAGGIGQPLSMLMAMDPNVSELCVYDLNLAMVPADGVAADLSHLNKKSKIRGFSFDKDDKAIDKAAECLTGCHLVLVPAGVPRKPGQDRKDLLNINAGIAKNIVEACAKYCPQAVVALIVNPVNSVVPTMCELWKKKGLHPSKIVGVTTLDVVRADKFVHELTNVPLEEIDVPVIGGHAGTTILPLFSQCKASRMIPADQIPALDKKVQDAGTVVVAAKNGKGSATLSMAFAGARLGKAVLSGLAGVPVTECAYVCSSVTDMPYFASKVTFGKDGVEKVHPIGDLSDYEKKRLAELRPILLEEISAGLEYANDNEFADSSPISVITPMIKQPTAILKTGNFKVCVIGGAGGIGQPLSMLMAMDPNVAELCVYDLTVAMVPADGVAADLSHLDNKCKVRGFAFDKDDRAIDKAGACLTGCHLVLVPAGVPRKPGQDRKDLLNINAGIAKNIVDACAKFCPEAVVALIVNPVNSVVPAMGELWKSKGLNVSKIVGVTTLDVVRSNKFVHEVTGAPMEEIDVPVIGGHAGTTILPLFSQCKAGKTIAADQIPALDKKVQDAGTVVVAAKNGKGSATLSMACAGARLGKAVLSGLAGVPATECAYVASSVTGLPYFASKVTFGKDGVETVHPLGDLSDYEKKRLAELFPVLLEEISAGLEYASEDEMHPSFQKESKDDSINVDLSNKNEIQTGNEADSTHYAKYAIPQEIYARLEETSYEEEVPTAAEERQLTKQSIPWLQLAGVAGLVVTAALLVSRSRAR